MRAARHSTAFRRFVRPFHFLGLVAALSLALNSGHADLLHRYSFEGDAGAATAGTLIPDSIGGADGVVIGTGALFSGTGSVSLPGGAGGSTAAYIDLPNGLLSVHSSVTFEAWYTLTGATAWGRVWDFGSSAGGEVPGSGGGGEGLDYFMFAPQQGTNINTQRNAIRNFDALAPGGGTGPVDNVEEDADGALASNLNQQYHVVSVWEATGVGGTLTLYRDGATVSSIATTFNATDINDVNNWLGRSNWTGDSYLQGSFNEFRIWNEAFDSAKVAESFAAGPNNPPGANDSDSDGMPNDYENLYVFLDPMDPLDADDDEDMDGLTNLEEFNAGTRPDLPDTDADGLPDADELTTYLTNPLIADSDGDTLGDGEEINIHMTSPILADTDGDGLRDGIEIHNALDPGNPAATMPALLHRWSFNEPAGAAPAGAVVDDQIGGAHGVVVGDSATFTGTEVTLPGGAGNSTAGYIDLPNTLLSPHETVTFEAWFTIAGAQAWGRVWDFGSSVGGEVTGSGGGGEGQDYFIYAPTHGTDINLQRYTARNLDAAAPGGGMGPVDGDEEPLDSALPTSLLQEHHVAGVWAANADGGGQFTIYRDGVNQGARVTTFNATDINDLNNWLGRSNWTADAYFQGSFNEFRIYEGAMNNASAAASFTAGPNADLGGTLFIITGFEFDPTTRSATIRWNSLPGAFYAVDASADLQDWGEINDNVMSGGSETSYSELAIPETETIRYYRVRPVP